MDEIYAAIRELQALLPRDADGDIAGFISHSTGYRIEELLGVIFEALPAGASQTIGE